MQDQQHLAGVAAMHDVMMRQAAQQNGADLGAMRGLRASMMSLQRSVDRATGAIEGIAQGPPGPAGPRGEPGIPGFVRFAGAEADDTDLGAGAVPQAAGVPVPQAPVLGQPIDNRADAIRQMRESLVAANA